MKVKIFLLNILKLDKIIIEKYTYFSHKWFRYPRFPWILYYQTSILNSFSMALNTKYFRILYYFSNLFFTLQRSSIITRFTKQQRETWLSYSIICQRVWCWPTHNSLSSPTWRYIARRWRGNKFPMHTPFAIRASPPRIYIYLLEILIRAERL